MSAFVQVAEKEREAVVRWHRAQAQKHRDDAVATAARAGTGTAILLQTGHLDRMATWHEVCADCIERGDHLS